MAIRANLADGRVLNFPDGTPDEVIQATVKRVISEAAPAPTAPARPERTWGQALGDFGVQLGEGANTLVGAIPGLLAPESEATKFFERGAEYWREKQSEPLKQRMAAADKSIQKAGEEGVISQIVEAATQYYDDPALAARFVVTNLPSMIPGLGATKLAQAAALAKGATAAKAAGVATTTGGAVNAILNAGGARAEAFEDIKKTLIAQEYSPAEAERKAIEDSRLVAAVGGVTGFISGKTGLEKAIAGGVAKGGVRAGAGRVAGELAGEQIEEVAPKFATNVQAAEYDARSLGKDIGRTIVETGIASGPGAALSGVMGGAREVPPTTPTVSPTGEAPPAPEMQEVRDRLAARGFSEEDIDRILVERAARTAAPPPAETPTPEAAKEPTDVTAATPPADVSATTELEPGVSEPSVGVPSGDLGRPTTAEPAAPDGLGLERPVVPPASRVEPEAPIPTELTETPSGTQAPETIQAKEEGSAQPAAPAPTAVEAPAATPPVEEKPARYQRLRAEQPWYSALDKAIEASPQKAAPAPQWKNVLTGMVNKGQAKRDEIEWTGVEDWLALQQGRVTKEQVQDYLKQGGVKVEETVLGAVSPELRDLRKRMNALSNELNSAKEDFQNSGYLYRDISVRSIDPPYLRPNYDILNSLPEKWQFRYDKISRMQEEYDKLANEEYDSPAARALTKYSQYTLPGGQNYREVLLTLPEREPTKVDVTGWTAKKEREKSPVTGKPEYRVFDAAGESRGKTYRFDTSEEAIRYIASAMEQQQAEMKRYKSSHWDQPNVLAHIRVNDRTDADGKKVLFVEEIQSDWGQERKKNLRMAEESGSQMVREGAEAKTPNAPFIGKTEGWLNLALKRVLTMAAEGGYDRVAFINGAQAHRRFPEKEDGTSTKESFDKYYNQIVPQTLNKLLPKVGGGKVGQVNLLKDSMRNYDSQIMKDDLERLGENGFRAKYAHNEQPGFDITPAMREKLAAGLPLFQKEDKEQPPQETGKYPLPAQAIEDLKGNNLALALEAIETSKPSEINKAIAARLKVLLKNTQVTIDDDLRDSKGNPVLGAASTSGSRIWLDANRGMNMETVLHESVHAATERILSTPEDQRTPQQNEAVRELTDLWNAAKANNDIKLTPEASDSLSEFVAEGMTNIELQDQLASVKWESRTMWQGFKRILLNMLGIKTPASMLDYTLASVDTIFAAVPKATTTTAPPAAPTPKPKVKQTESKAFKDWFGDSKVVDENGEPLVLYRGIRGEAPGALNAEPRDDYNTFLSSSPAVAATYGMSDRFEVGSILPVYVKANRLIEFPVSKDKYGYNKFDKAGFDRRAATLRPGEVLVARQVVDIGPMGPEAYAVDPEKKYSYPSDIYALGKGTSVKSATGNIGTFDVTNPDIRYQKPKLTAEEKAKKEAEEADAKVTEALEKFAKSKTSEEAAKAASTLQSLRSSKTAIPQLRRLYDSGSDTTKRALLTLIPTEYVAEVASKDVPELQRTTELLSRMSGMTEQLIHGASQTSDRISRAFKKDPLLRGRLEEVVYASTLAQIDPSTNKTSEKLNTLYKALGEEGQTIYKDVRDYYTDMGDLYSQLIKTNIERSGASEESKAAILAKLKVLFEPANRMRPYFPLMRRGDYWFSSGKGKDRRFHMFESMPERDAALEAFARSEGKSLQTMKETSEVKFGNDVSSLREIDKNTDKTLTDVMTLVDKFDTGSATSKKELLDSVYQLYLHSLPEPSFRKHYVTRQDAGRAGFSTDLLRNFSQSAIQMSGQLARVKYGSLIRASLSSAKASIENQPQYEPYVEEMTKRAELDLVPPARTTLDAVADATTKASFMYYMSSLSSALMQPLGIIATGASVLGARHGYIKTAVEIAKLAKIWDASFTMSRKLPDGSTTITFPTIVNSKAIVTSPDERRAVNEMLARDVSQSTMAREMYGYRAKPTDQLNLSASLPAKTFSMLFLGGLMHHMERISREIVFLTSYRLNIAEQKSHKAAADAAVKDTTDSLGNFSQYARPRIMRNPGGKVALQYSGYSLWMISFLSNNFYKMLPLAKNKEGKAEAAKIFFGTLGTTWILAGIAGFPAPVTELMMGFISAMFSMLSDDEEMPDEMRKQNFTKWFNEILIPSELGHIEVFGRKLSDIVKTGPLSAATGWDFASRTSISNLLLRDQKETKTFREALENFALERIGGPSLNMILNASDGAQAFKEGDYQRGIEKVAPASVRSIAQTYRFMEEGAKDIKGSELFTKGNFTKGELLGRSIGLQPSKLANLQKSNAEANQEIIKMTNERNLLMRKLDIASRKDTDFGERQFIGVLEDIDAYNEKYPTNRISSKDVREHLESKAKERAKSMQGVTMTEKTPIDVQRMIDLSRTK